jgi:hypothetical protein
MSPDSMLPAINIILPDDSIIRIQQMIIFDFKFFLKKSTLRGLIPLTTSSLIFYGSNEFLGYVKGGEFCNHLNLG